MTEPGRSPNVGDGVDSMIVRKIRLALGAGAICSALTLGTVGSAFAAPPNDPTPPAVTASATSAANPVGAKHAHALGLIHLLHGIFKPVAQLFGITPAQLRTQLGHGQTLAQIAANYGKSATAVQTALTNELKTRLDKLVANGKLTSARETTILTNAAPKISAVTSKNLAPLIRRIEHRRTVRRQHAKPQAQTAAP